MTPKITATVLFCLLLMGPVIFFIYYGRLSFWKLIHEDPVESLALFAKRDAWVVTLKGQPRPEGNYVGPFIFVQPEGGEILHLYAKKEQLEKSQNEFIKNHPKILQCYTFPWLSALALLYPIIAMSTLGNNPASLVPILGYGLSNLGYIIAAGAVCAGSFRVLGFETRVQTFVGAVLFWVAGVILSSI